MSVKIALHVFGKRFWLRPRIEQNVLQSGHSRFEEDDRIMFQERMARKRAVKTYISVEDADERTALPSDVVKEFLSRTDDIFVTDFCFCRKSDKC